MRDRGEKKRTTCRIKNVPVSVLYLVHTAQYQIFVLHLYQVRTGNFRYPVPGTSSTSTRIVPVPGRLSLPVLDREEIAIAIVKTGVSTNLPGLGPKIVFSLTTVFSKIFKSIEAYLLTTY